jgi:hypothetical protein
MSKSHWCLLLLEDSTVNRSASVNAESLFRLQAPTPVSAPSSLTPGTIRVPNRWYRDKAPFVPVERVRPTRSTVPRLDHSLVESRASRNERPP